MVTCSCEFGVYLLPPCKKQAPPTLARHFQNEAIKGESLSYDLFFYSEEQCLMLPAHVPWY